VTLTSNLGDSPGSDSTIMRRRLRGHTRLVHALRWVMPVGIVALLGLLAAFVAAEAMRSAHAGIKDVPTEIRMVNPHFVGRDDQGRSFNMSARQAAREDADMQRVDLVAPVMIMDMDGPRPKTLTADRGVYDESTRLLRLHGHVRIDDSAASTVATEDAVVDTKAGTVTGKSAIAANSPTGAVQAGSYTVDEHSQHVILRGGVHGQIKGR
jgi:lipopolysaccharide export system protein LptC